MGLLQGKVQNDTFIVIDSFALPVEGTETRVNAQAEAYEYMVDFQGTSKVGLDIWPCMGALYQPRCCSHVHVIGWWQGWSACVMLCAHKESSLMGDGSMFVAANAGYLSPLCMGFACIRGKGWAKHVRIC